MKFSTSNASLEVVSLDLGYAYTKSNGNGEKYPKQFSK
jgi:hypothetical protein